MSGSNPFEAASFDPTHASQELRRAVEQLSALGLSRPDRPLTPEEARAARQVGPGGGAFQLGDPMPERAEIRRIPGPAGPVELRCFRPRAERPRATMLHIHGGAWFAGSADMMDAGLVERAERLNISIASVEYRLAPEHPYPAAPDDCEAAAAWLAKHAASELGAELALIGGESAGGHLAAVTLVRMRERHGFRFAGANLVYGVYDLSGVPSHSHFDGRGLIIDGPSIRAFTQMFVPDESRWRDPDISPLYADLSGLCPALFTVGTFDPLLDHSLFMYAEWAASGNPAEIQIFPGAPHGFDGFPVPEAASARETIDTFLELCLGNR
jgi:acetyl esterase/lipase